MNLTIHEDTQLIEFWNGFSKTFDLSKNNNSQQELIIGSVSDFLKLQFEKLLQLQKNSKSKDRIKEVFQAIENLKNIEMNFELSKQIELKNDIGKNLQRIISRIHMINIPSKQKSKITNMIKEKQKELEEKAILKKNFLIKLNSNLEKVKELLNKVNDSNIENLTEEEKVLLEKVFKYIVENHPFMSSLKQPIKVNGRIIKYEMLVGNNLFEDKIIKETLGIHKGIFLDLLNSEYMNEINISFTKQHIISKIYDLEHNNDTIKVSINISKYELNNKEFIDDLRKINFYLKQNHENVLLKDLINFEFLESNIDFDNEVIKEHLKILKNELGIDFGIDDFGIENSDFDRFNRLVKYNNSDYVSFLKIDMSLTSAEMIQEIFEKEKFENSVIALRGLTDHFTNILSYEQIVDEDKYLLKEIIKNYLEKIYIKEIEHKLKNGHILGKELFLKIINDNHFINEINFQLKNKNLDIIFDNKCIINNIKIMQRNIMNILSYINNINKNKTVVFEFIDLKSMEKYVIEKSKVFPNITFASQGFLYFSEFKEISHFEVNKKYYKQNGFGKERRKKKREQIDLISSLMTL